MKKENIKRLYNFSDAVLITKTKAKIKFVRRDIKEFLAFGITSEMIAELEKDTNIFSDMPTDLEAKRDLAISTQARDYKAEELRVAIRNLMLRVQMTFGIKTARYKSFATARLSKKVGADLLLAGKTAVQKGTDFSPKLTANGVTTEMLTAISVLCDELENLILEQEIKSGDRSLFQENRITMGNAIYAKLMSYTAVGFSIWETRSRARYNDYVVYTSGKRCLSLLSLEYLFSTEHESYNTI